MRRAILTLGAAALALLGACENAPSPITAAPEPPAFARSGTPRAAEIPVLERDSRAPGFREERVEAEFTPGEAGELTLRFRDGSPYATFRVHEQSLVGARVKGERLRRKDPVRISMARVDDERFMVEFEPAGLVFNPAAPAELSFHYRHSARRSHHREITIWKQESDGTPWLYVPASDNVMDQTLASTKIEGFTKYAVATRGEQGDGD